MLFFMAESDHPEVTDRTLKFNYRMQGSHNYVRRVLTCALVDFDHPGVTDRTLKLNY